MPLLCVTRLLTLNSIPIYSTNHVKPGGISDILITRRLYSNLSDYKLIDNTSFTRLTEVNIQIFVKDSQFPTVE